MSRKVAVFIGIKENADVITGGERQLQELIKGLKRHAFDVRCVSVDGALSEMSDIASMYGKENVYIFSDYSKRFFLWKIIWKCKRVHHFHICASVGAFYFDYRTSKLKNLIDYVVSFLYLIPSDIIFTTGKAVGNKLRKMGCKRKKIVNVYPALRESLIKEAYKKDSFVDDEQIKTVLTVGRFHPVKGYEYLLDAVKLCRDLKDIRFMIVGDYERKPDDYYRHIKQRIHDEGLSDRIIIYGRTKDDAELAALYRKCWCYLHTSVWETSPITVCEPLLFGKPVIATNVGGTAEYLTDGVDSILVTNKSGNVIAESIKSLYKNEKLYQKLQNNALINSEKYVSRRWYDVGEEYFSAINTND